MSEIDIHQMYLGENMCGYSFGMVISPRREGIKVLCFRLTEEGKAHLNYLREEAVKRREPNVRRYMIDNLAPDIKYYYQVPFEVSSEPYTVADTRSEDEVIDALRRFIAKGGSGNCWE